MPSVDVVGPLVHAMQASVTDKKRPSRAASGRAGSGAENEHGGLRRLFTFNSAARKRVSVQVRRLLDGIHSNPYDPNLSVKTLKVRCGLRDNNVSCRFKSETGVSLHEYIAVLRVRTAVDLLHCPALSVAEVADLIGYGHLQTFYRIFRRYFPCNPGAFRRQRGVSCLRRTMVVQDAARLCGAVN